MDHTDELNELLDESARKNDHIELKNTNTGNAASNNRAKKLGSKKNPNKSYFSNIFDTVLTFCSFRQILYIALAVTVFIFLFSTIEVSLVDKRRWVPQLDHRLWRTKQNDSEISIQQQFWKNYEQKFNKSVLAPFRELLTKLENKYLSNTSKQNSLEKKLKISEILPPRVQLNDSQTMILAESESNLAARYFDKWRTDNFGSGAPRFPNVTYCPQVKMISPHLVRQNNLYWQVVTSVQPNFTLYAYNAYYDDRLWGKPAVKMITVTDRQIGVEKRPWWCLLWFDNLSVPVLSNVTDVYTVWPEFWGFGVKDGVFGPQIVTCAIPYAYSNQIPQAISLQTVGQCKQINEKPRNVLRVINNRPTKISKNNKKPSIAVCVQAFRFGTYDVSVRLVEWLEMVRIMGAEKVYFYVYGATQNMLKVLEHYKKDGLVDWRRLTLPGEQVNVPSLYNYYYSKLGGQFWPTELIELNDCLYRTINRHQYVGIFDIDEMIVPRKVNNWHSLIESIENKLTASEMKTKAYYLNRHAYVYEMFEETEMTDKRSIPDYLYMMRHTYRAELYDAGTNIKCLHRTDLVFATHNHFPMRCINTTGHHHCQGLVIDPEDSMLFHYRRNRPPPKDCKTPETPIKCAIHDQTAWRFFDLLEASTRSKLITIFGHENYARISSDTSGTGTGRKLQDIF